MPSTVDVHQFEPFLEKGQTILTPGKRLARAIAEAWVINQQDHQSVFFEASVQPVDAWLEQAWCNAVENGLLPMQWLLSAEQQRTLWHEIIRRDIGRNQNFTLTQPRAAALRAKTAWDKLSMHGGLEISSLWGHFQHEEDCRIFARWARQFEAQLKKIGGVTRYQAYSQLLSLPAQSTPVALYGFPDLPSLTMRALEHLSDLELVAPKQSIRSDPAPHVRAFSTREDELAAAATWAHAMSQRSDHRSAIVLLDLERDRNQLEYFLRAQFGCLDAQYNDLPVNFSTGMPLGTTPMFRDAVLALEWEVRPLLRSDWVALMRSPFFPGLLRCPSPNDLQLVERLFKSGLTEISMDQTLHFLTRYTSDSPLKTILLNIRGDRSHRKKKSLVAWAAWIRQRLKLWEWPSRESLDSIEYQQINRFDDSLDTLAELSSVLPNQSHEEALTQWRQSLSNMPFQPKTPYDSVQVMGPLEVIGLEFDGIWICGAQQGSLPQLPRLDGFLPASLQKRLNFSDLNAAHLHAQGQKALEISVAASTETIVSYHQLDRGLPRQPSVLITAPKVSNESSWFPPSRWQAARQVEDMPWQERIPIEAGQHAGGSSLIRDQAACPFKAFISHRLKVTRLGSEAFGFTAVERGLLLHEMMFYLWRDLGSQSALLDLPKQQLQERIERAATVALKKLEDDASRHGYSLRARVGESCWQLERAFSREIVEAWMMRERNREHPFTVVSLEEESVLTLSGLELTLRPDRIDRLEDGRLIVIDYKSTAPAKSRWLGPRPQEPQLPLYTFLNPALEGIAFAPLARESQFISLGSDLGLTKTPDRGLAHQTAGWAGDWKDLVSKWSSALASLAEAFVEGDPSIDPTPGACQHCELKSVCRIDQLRQTDRPLSLMENEVAG